MECGSSEPCTFTPFDSEKWLGWGGGVHPVEVPCVSPQDGSMHCYQRLPLPEPRFWSVTEILQTPASKCQEEPCRRGRCEVSAWKPHHPHPCRARCLLPSVSSVLYETFPMAFKGGLVLGLELCYFRVSSLWKECLKCPAAPTPQPPGLVPEGSRKDLALQESYLPVGHTFALLQGVVVMT